MEWLEKAQEIATQVYPAIEPYVEAIGLAVVAFFGGARVTSGEKFGKLGAALGRIFSVVLKTPLKREVRKVAESIDAFVDAFRANFKNGERGGDDQSVST